MCARDLGPNLARGGHEYGHERVALLNGPRDKWIAEGRSTVTDVPVRPRAVFTPRPPDDG